MEQQKTPLSKFVAEVVARLTGDTDTVTALKNERLAKASIKGQISALEGALVNAEVEVSNAEDKLFNAIYPTILIANQAGYYKTIIGAKEQLKEAEEVLSNTKESIAYAEELLATKF